MIRSILALAVTGVALPISVPLQAETLEDTAARYGIRASILDISLSPSGGKIAYISPGPAHTEILNVVDLNGSAEVKQIVSNTEQHTDLSQCDWATETRIVCMIVGTAKLDATNTLVGLSRLFSVKDDGSDVVVLTERRSARALTFRQDGGSVVALDVPDETNRILMTKEYVPERTIGTRLANDQSGLGIDEVDVTNGRRKSVERPDEMATRYIADQFGRVRLKSRHLHDNRGVLTGKRVYLYRDAESDRWQTLDGITIDGKERTEFVPAAIDSTKNVIYGFDEIDGFDAIVEVALDRSNEGKVIMSRDDVDVDQLIRIGRQKRVVGASYATEKRSVKYFDEELAKLSEGLQRVLPGNPLVNVVGASADESKLLLIASRDTDPGMVYLYEKATRRLEPLLPMRNFLVDQPMGQMEPVTFPAQDGAEIPGYLTLPPGSDGKSLPAIVLPHGGPSARDEWGFDWLVQFFANRGYAVLQPNYRGSSGYGDAWFGKNGFQAWETAIGDVNDAGRWLVAQGIAKPDKLAIVGWSYGGYAALQSQVVDPSLYKAVVAIAPVVDLDMLRQDARAYTNYQLVDRFIGDGPHVRAGSPAQHADRFAAPVRLFHGTLDQNVDVRHSRVMADRLKDAGRSVQYIEYEGLEHSLRDSAVRAKMLAEIDTFLNQSMGD